MKRSLKTRALIVGAAGVLGSALTEKFLEMGIGVRAMDVCRIDEAWRLATSKERIDYRWKASFDIDKSDLEGIDVIFDSGIGVADRPLGNSSPTFTLALNIQPSLHLLEALRALPPKKRPVAIYPSSFNALYGYGDGAKYSPRLLPNPSSMYGWTKASVELLYSTFQRAYGIPAIITRVGSGYGPRMRSDELPARLILDVLSGREIILKSPRSRRLWTYAEDITDFYKRLVESLPDNVGRVIHCAGNRGNQIVTNLELTKLVFGIAKQTPRVKQSGYEDGELVDGKPISFEVAQDSSLWRPNYTLRGGLSKTFSWFKENRWRYK